MTVPLPAGWVRHAACVGLDPDLFFPARGEPIDEARQVCAACPVAAECLDYALRWRICFGVWGGRSEQQRKRLRNQTRWVRPAKDPETIPHATLPRYRRGCRCDGCREANRVRDGRRREVS